MIVPIELANRVLAGAPDRREIEGLLPTVAADQRRMIEFVLRTAV